MTPRRKWLKRLAIGSALAMGLWLLGSYAVAYRLTRRSRPRCDEPTPAVTWAKFTTLRITTEDHEELGAWYIEGRPERPLVLVLHGNGRCRSECLAQAELATTTGCAVLLISLRAHGDSTGKLNDLGYSARKDVIAAVEWLEQHNSGKPIIIWGQSLGAAAAVFAAEQLGARVRDYILECPYQDLRTAVWNRTQFYLPPVLDGIAYAGLLSMAPLVLSNVNEISPFKAIDGMPSSARVLLLSGGADRRARPEEAQALYERVKDHARMVVIEGGDHLELAAADPILYRTVIQNFLSDAP